MIAAGIVLYSPDIERLNENIGAIGPQVGLVILVDNGSADKSYLAPYLADGRFVVISNEENMGIAHALNQIMEYASAHDIPWVLTLDQDSVVQSDIIGTYEALKAPDIGIISCWIEDRNFQRDESWGLSQGVIELDWCITSASYTSTEAWKAAGGFDDRMFIDWVDWDFGIAVKNAGYRIIRTYKTKLTHELGRATKVVRIGNYDFIVQNKPSIRYYYGTRNLVYMARKYRHIKLHSQLKLILRNSYVILRYEGNKWRNLKAIVKGLFSGFTMEMPGTQLPR